MDAAAALADLTEISSQVETAAVFGSDGSTLASTFADDEAAARLVLYDLRTCLRALAPAKPAAKKRRAPRKTADA